MIMHNACYSYLTKLIKWSNSLCINNDCGVLRDVDYEQVMGVEFCLQNDSPFQEKRLSTTKIFIIIQTQLLIQVDREDSEAGKRGSERPASYVQRWRSSHIVWKSRFLRMKGWLLVTTRRSETWVRSPSRRHLPGLGTGFGKEAPPSLQELLMNDLIRLFKREKRCAKQKLTAFRQQKETGFLVTNAGKPSEVWIEVCLWRVLGPLDAKTMVSWKFCRHVCMPIMLFLSVLKNTTLWIFFPWDFDSQQTLMFMKFQCSNIV